MAFPATSLPSFTPLVLDEEDESTLEDVMAFIDGFESPEETAHSGIEGTHLSFSSEELEGFVLDFSNPEDASSRQTAADKTSARESAKHATPKRNKHREKVKRELQYLRTRAVELDRELMTLRQRTMRISSREKQRGTSSTAWQRIAKSQLETRQLAEAENQRLKTELRMHTEMAGSMMATMDEMTASHEKEKRTVQTTPRRALHKGLDVDVFAALIDDLDATFARMNSIFQTNGLSVGASPREATRHCRTTMHVSESGTATPLGELRDVTVTPFKPRITAKCMWRMIVQQYGHRDRFSVEKKWQTENTLAVKFRTLCTLKNSRGELMYLNTRLVVRKCVGERNSNHHMVLVWRAYNEGEETPPGVYADETGWAVVDGITLSSGRPGSIIRQCVHVEQQHHSDAHRDQQHPSGPGILTDLVLRSIDEDFTDISTAMANMHIVGDAIKGTGCTV